MNDELPYGTLGGPTVPAQHMSTSQAVTGTMAIPQGMRIGESHRLEVDPDAIEPAAKPTTPLRVVLQCAGCGRELSRQESDRLRDLEDVFYDADTLVCPVCDAAALLDRERYESEWRARWQREHPGEDIVVLA